MIDTSISVLVPAYQEEASIERVLHRIEQVLVRNFSEYEIVVIADGCTDKTAMNASKFGSPKVKVIEYHPNRGKGHALKTGFKSSYGELVAFCDGDLDIDPESLVILTEMLFLQNAGAAVGSKTHSNSVVVYPPVRRVLSKIFSLITAIFFRLGVRDTQTGLKVFRREILINVLDTVEVKGFAFDLELLVKLSKSNLIIEGPVQIDYQFDSRISLMEPYHMLRDLVGIWIRIRKER
jgi:glycosyltransferase involved in cell wall biosynthesis